MGRLLWFFLSSIALNWNPLEPCLLRRPNMRLFVSRTVPFTTVRCVLARGRGEALRHGLMAPSTRESGGQMLLGERANLPINTSVFMRANGPTTSLMGTEFLKIKRGNAMRGTGTKMSLMEKARRLGRTGVGTRGSSEKE